MTSKQFPSWLIYRNELFDRISENMSFDVFTVFRDRQLTNSLLQSKGDIRVLKSRNIKRDGSGIESIQGYDSFIDENNVNKFSVANFLERDDVFLSPNMTYYPRVIRKPKNTLVNG
ncbi:TPA: DNA methyltransferase, partial [Streptococcus suis]|nr:DNA methyltransferase [Streptococcus suis]